MDEIDAAIQKAKVDPRPSLILCHTHIGFGLPTRQDTSKAHGEPPGDEELNGAKQKLGYPVEPRFYVADDVLKHFRQAVPQGEKLEKEWNEQFTAFRAAYPELAVELQRRINGDLPQGWDQNLPEFPADPKGMATRVASGKMIAALAPRLPELIGGSADLTPSNNTAIPDTRPFQADSRSGRYFHFGVREHGMGSIVNGMALHQGVIPFGATFLVFYRLYAACHSSFRPVSLSLHLGDDSRQHRPGRRRPHPSAGGTHRFPPRHAWPGGAPSRRCK